MLDHRLFMVTLDAHLLAFDRATGRILWDTVLADYKIGYSATLAPLVIDGKVIVGISGGEYPTKGFLDAYDPELNTLYWGTGNPNPDYYGADRQGDSFYTNSLVAIDAATGTLKWHYQFTPHDAHDWDSNHVPVLADLADRKVVMVANRNGFSTCSIGSAVR